MRIESAKIFPTFLQSVLRLYRACHIKCLPQRIGVLTSPVILMDVFAAIGYLPDGDWRKVVYWLAAATLTAVITF